MRYEDKYTRVRAYCHFMLYGLAVAFTLKFTVYGWLVVFLPLLMEAQQWMTDVNYDVEDGAWDLLECVSGGLVIGSLFYWL